MGVAYCHGAILNLLLVVVIGCTKVYYVTTSDNVLMPEVGGLLIGGSTFISQGAPRGSMLALWLTLRGRLFTRPYLGPPTS